MVLYQVSNLRISGASLPDYNPSLNSVTNLASACGFSIGPRGHDHVLPRVVARRVVRSVISPVGRVCVVTALALNAALVVAPLSLPLSERQVTPRSSLVAGLGQDREHSRSRRQKARRLGRGNGRRMGTAHDPQSGVQGKEWEPLNLWSAFLPAAGDQ